MLKTQKICGGEDDAFILEITKSPLFFLIKSLVN